MKRREEWYPTGAMRAERLACELVMQSAELLAGLVNMDEGPGGGSNPGGATASSVIFLPVQQDARPPVNILDKGVQVLPPSHPHTLKGFRVEQHNLLDWD